MKKVIAILLFGLTLLGCFFYYGRTEEPEGEAYQVYFLPRDLDSAIGAGALQTETVYLQEETVKDTQKAAYVLMNALLNGPRVSYLESAIPEGTKLKSLTVEGSRALVDLSSEYIGLSGVELTLADYAVTLTLSQISDILSVKITVNGQELGYRDRQILTSQDVRLAPQGDVVSTVEAVLYFLDEEYWLVEEKRELDLYEGDTQVMAVTRALEAGTENKGLRTPFPEGFRVKSVWLEERSCYVNLSSGLLGSMPVGVGLHHAITALGRSLCSLETVDEVRFLVDGEFSNMYGLVDISEPFTD